MAKNDKAAGREDVKPISFEESILRPDPAPQMAVEIPVNDPDFQALMRQECKVREESNLAIDDTVLHAVRSRWAVLKAAKPAKA